MANKKARGKRAKTRSKFTRRKGKLTVNKLVHQFEKGQKVVITIDPSVHGGMPHSRYQGRIGKVTGKRGSVFDLDVKLGNLPKQLFVSAAHLTRAKTTQKE